MQLVLKIALHGIMVVLFLDIFILYMNSHPPRHPLYIPPSKFNLRYEDVSFLSTGGVRLKGWFYTPDLIIFDGQGNAIGDRRPPWNLVREKT